MNTDTNFDYATTARILREMMAKSRELKEREIKTNVAVEEVLKKVRDWTSNFNGENFLQCKIRDVDSPKEVAARVSKVLGRDFKVTFSDWTYIYVYLAE